jgi:hypothetical protein
MTVTVDIWHCKCASLEQLYQIMSKVAQATDVDGQVQSWTVWNNPHHLRGSVGTQDELTVHSRPSCVHITFTLRLAQEAADVATTLIKDRFRDYHTSVTKEIS